MEEFIGQSRYLNNENYQNFLFLFLQECENLNDLDKNPESISQILFLCEEILIINQDRIGLVWKNFTNFLKFFINFQKEETDALSHLDEKLQKVCEKMQKIKIKHQNKKFFLTSFCKFCLLKLCLLFLHKSDELFMYDNLLIEALKYLNECSIELINDFFVEIQEFLHFDLILDKLIYFFLPIFIQNHKFLIF